MHLYQFPDEILLQIFLKLSLREFVFLNLVSRNLYRLTTGEKEWHDLLNIHFPRIANNSKNNSRQQFRSAYRSEYKNLFPRLKRMFSSVKEGNLQDLIKPDVVASFHPLSNLTLDANGLTLFDWAHLNKRKNILSWLYIRACNTQFAFLQPTPHAVLELAVTFGMLEQIDYLTSQGAIPTDAMLRIAIRNRDLPMIAKLLEIGIVETRLEGHSLLWEAIYTRDLQIVRLLISRCPEEILYDAGKCPLHIYITIAALDQNVDILRFLISQLLPDLRRVACRKALEAVINSEEFSFSEKIIDCLLDNIPANKQSSCLRQAIIHTKLDIAEIILKRNVTIGINVRHYIDTIPNDLDSANLQQYLDILSRSLERYEHRSQALGMITTLLTNKISVMDEITERKMMICIAYHHLLFSEAAPTPFRAYLRFFFPQETGLQRRIKEIENHGPYAGNNINP